MRYGSDFRTYVAGEGKNIYVECELDDLFCWCDFLLWSNGLNQNPVVDCYLLGMIKKVSGKPDEPDFVVGNFQKVPTIHCLWFGANLLNIEGINCAGRRAKVMRETRWEKYAFQKVCKKFRSFGRIQTTSQSKWTFQFVKC